MCMSFLPAFVYVCHMYAWWPLKSEEGVRFPGIRVIDDCEPNFGHL